MAKNTQKSLSITIDQWASRVLVKIMLGLLRFYRYFLSPWIGNQCKFYPTCSQYSEAAYKEHGFFKGSYLTLVRILKCNPWHAGGIDEVPSKNKRVVCCDSHQHQPNNQ